METPSQALLGAQRPARAPARRRLLGRYGAAAGIAGGAVVLTQLFLEPLAGAHFLFSMGAICLAALMGGTGPAMLALAICAAAYPLLAREQLASFWIAPGYHGPRLALFVLVGAAEAVAAGALRRAQLEAKRARLRTERRAERQRRARRRSAEQLQVLRTITSNLAEGLYALDLEGRLVFMNEAASRMLGWTDAELAGKVFHDIVHSRRGDGSPLTAEECPMLSVLREGRAVAGQDQVYVRRDGSAFPVSYTSSPIVRGGRVTGAAVAFQDFTEHLRAERGERFLAEASRALTESLDWESTLERVAALAVPVLGDWCLVVGEQERLPRSVAVAAADPGQTAEVREALAGYPIDPDAAHGVGRVLRTGAPELLADVSVEEFVAERGPAGETRAEILRRLGLRSYLGVPLIARGRTLGAIGFGRSRAGRPFGEEDLALARELAARCALALDNARLYREAQEATRSREEVLAVVSHDLRAPLAAVQLAAQLLGKLVPEESSPALARAADTLRRSTARVARLVDDLVDFARLERGKLSIHRAPQDCESIAKEAMALAEPVAAEQGVRLALDAAPGAGLAQCDRHRILQVLANLIGNAVKVMPGGGEVRLAVRPEGSGVRFTVADSGPGIAPEDQPRVFERYWRAKDAGYAGTGLGLAIARAFVEAHGGKIWVESAPGEGAAFSFTVPREPPVG